MFLDQLPDDILNKIYQDNYCCLDPKRNLKSKYFYLKQSCQNIKQACFPCQCQLKCNLIDLQTNVIICQQHQVIVIQNFDFQLYFQIQYLVGLNIIIVQVYWTHQLLDYYYLWNFFYLIDQKIIQLEYFWDYFQQVIIKLIDYLVFYYNKDKKNQYLLYQ